MFDLCGGNDETTVDRAGPTCCGSPHRKPASIIKDTYFTNVASEVNQVIHLHGKSSSVNITGVHFSNFTVKGKAITSQTDADAKWDINLNVSGITFDTTP